jgi:hypothetical protein
MGNPSKPVTPAKASIQATLISSLRQDWIPVFAGATGFLSLFRKK